MTALDSMGTGLLSMVLRLLSSLCHETEGRGSPDAWHSRLMGSPTLTCIGPTGVTVATGDSGGTDTKYWYNSVSDQPLEGTPHLEFYECVMTEMWLTFDNQRHNGVGDAKRVARHTTVGTMIHRAGIGNGDNRTIIANFNIICRTEEQIKY